MNSQTTTSNDRSRTYWTPLMERYFIDLMLEHLHRGNRVGHTFNKQAWTDMLIMFNAKFGSQYDKDVLKSRYTNLWKQFNDVRSLLNQNGFTWDVSRKIVVADDYVWDAYVKAHPEARCYRTKPVLNFDDLCVIYGYVTADGRYSLSSHDVGFDDEVQGLNMGDGLGSIAPSGNERPRTEWNDAMDQYFIELLLDQVGRGSDEDNAFSKQAWTNMLAMFNSKFGSQHNKRVLRHRYKKLLKYYTDITVLLTQGFLWDEKHHMVAADDDLWNAYVKAHPQARAYRMKSFPYYHDLELIFRNGSVDRISSLHQEKKLEHVISEIKTGEGKRGHNHSSTDRTRTYWTPPMDRCFIDLLLKQVKKGNKLGQTFNTQAWNDMITAFNEEFKAQYDKDVLKNRYKHLRKQFSDVSNLLQRDGFLWDDTREMVDAEDRVWDAYTKIHPDARSLRVKTLPGYHKLCIIFQQESSNGRYSHLASAADPISELPVLTIGEEVDEFCPSVYDATSTIKWTESMKCCFVDLMIEQVNRGNRIGNTFNEKAWAHMIEAFNAKLGLHCDMRFLKDQYFYLMKLHDDISNLLNHGGFVWDETLRMVIAENDVWEAYIKDHPDAVSYRNKFLDSYHDLCDIYGNKASDALVNVRGQLQWIEANETAIEMDVEGTTVDLVVTGNAEILDRNKNRPCETDTNKTLGNLIATGSTEISNRKSKRPGEMPSEFKPPKKVLKTELGVQAALSEMRGAVKTLMKKKETKSENSVENALSALQAMPDIDEELVMDACDLLEDERKAKTFLALDVSLRKKWLLRKLRA